MVAVVALMAILKTTRLITELTDWLRLPVLAVGGRTVKALTVPVNLGQTNLGSEDFCCFSIVVAVVALMAILGTTRLITELTDWLRLPVLAVGGRTVKALTEPVSLGQMLFVAIDFLELAVTAFVSDRCDEE